MADTWKGMMSVPYPMWDKVQYQLGLLPVRVTDTAFGADVEVTLEVRTRDRDRVEQQLSEQTNSQAEILWLANTFEPWPTENNEKESNV